MSSTARKMKRERMRKVGVGGKSPRLRGKQKMIRDQEPPVPVPVMPILGWW